MLAAGETMNFVDLLKVQHGCVINRREELHQRGVVGKMPEARAQGGQGIEKSTVGRRPSCCLPGGGTEEPDLGRRTL
jgi:hypothetical protein